MRLVPKSVDFKMNKNWNTKQACFQK